MLQLMTGQWYIFGMFNVKDFGAIGDGTTDDLAAFNAAITAMGTPASNQGALLFVPRSTYRLSGPLHITRPLRMVGETGSGWYGQSILLFDASNTGIIFDSYSTSPDGGRANWSVIEHLVIQGNQGSADSFGSHGIFMRYKAQIQNCYITNFKGHAVYISGDSHVIPPTNDNGWQLWYCRMDNCGGDGVRTEGGDANVGLALGLDIGAMGGWGISENGFLGSTYIACQVAECAAGGYQAINRDAQNVFLGC